MKNLNIEYYSLACILHQRDESKPYATRAIAQHELANLMVAVRCAIAARHECVVDFVGHVNRFLTILGLQADYAELTRQLHLIAENMPIGSQLWCQAQNEVGIQLLDSGQLQKAHVVFREVLNALGETISYDRCVSLGQLGRCLKEIQPQQAARFYEQAHKELSALREFVHPDMKDAVSRQLSVTLMDLGEILTRTGDYEFARNAYKKAQIDFPEILQARGLAVLNLNLGTIAMLEGKLPEAEVLWGL
jgi:tetratricopeptide (TPR) repeat protein